MSMTGEEFAARLRDGADDLHDHVMGILTAFANDVEESAKENFVIDDLPRRPSKKFGFYRDYRNASDISGYLKGPRNINNNLFGSILGESAIVDGMPSAIITAGKVKPLKYAAAIEYGRPEVNIEPRMFIGRAMNKHIDEIPKFLRDLLFVAIQGQKVEGAI